MKKESAAEKDKHPKTTSSMALFSETVCEDDACIGKDVKNPSLKAREPDKLSGKNTKKPGSSMSFGGKQGCTDEACIGKT